MSVWAQDNYQPNTISETWLWKPQRAEVLAGGRGHGGEDQGEAQLERHHHRGGVGPQWQQPHVWPRVLHGNHTRECSSR